MFLLEVQFNPTPYNNFQIQLASIFLLMGKLQLQLLYFMKKLKVILQHYHELINKNCLNLEQKK